MKSKIVYHLALFHIFTIGIKLTLVSQYSFLYNNIINHPLYDIMLPRVATCSYTSVGPAVVVRSDVSCCVENWLCARHTLYVTCHLVVYYILLNLCFVWFFFNSFKFSVLFVCLYVWWCLVIWIGNLYKIIFSVNQFKTSGFFFFKLKNIFLLICVI